MNNQKRRLTLVSLATFSCVFPASVHAAPSTCWSTSSLNNRGNMEGFDCDVSIKRDHKDEVYWQVQSGALDLMVYTDFDQDRATVYFPDGDSKWFHLEVDKDLDVQLTGTNDYAFVYAPSDQFKRDVRQRVAENQRQQPKTRQVMSTTPFRF